MSRQGKHSLNANLKPFVDFIIACFTFNKRKNESAWLDIAFVIVLSEQFIALVLKLVMYVIRSHLKS